MRDLHSPPLFGRQPCSLLTPMPQMEPPDGRAPSFPRYQRGESLSIRWRQNGCGCGLGDRFVRGRGRLRKVEADPGLAPGKTWVAATRLDDFAMSAVLKWERECESNARGRAYETRPGANTLPAIQIEMVRCVGSAPTPPGSRPGMQLLHQHLAGASTPTCTALGGLQNRRVALYALEAEWCAVQELHPHHSLIGRALWAVYKTAALLLS